MTQPLPLPAENVLLLRLRSGDEAAFRELVTAWSPALRRHARRFVRSEALAEEVVQETWLGVLRGLRRFEGRSSLKTWIFTILTNRARTRGSREARCLPLSALLDPDRGLPSEPDRFIGRGAWAEPPFQSRLPGAESLAHTRETLAVVEQALSQLPARQQAVVRMRDIEGLDAASTCSVMRISEANQRVLLHRGRSRLRAALRAHEQQVEREAGGLALAS